jgi:hypothetical protein
VSDLDEIAVPNYRNALDIRNVNAAKLIRGSKLGRTCEVNDADIAYSIRDLICTCKPSPYEESPFDVLFLNPSNIN